MERRLTLKCKLDSAPKLLLWVLPSRDREGADLRANRTLRDPLFRRLSNTRDPRRSAPKTTGYDTQSARVHARRSAPLRSRLSNAGVRSVRASGRQAGSFTPLQSPFGNTALLSLEPIKPAVFTPAASRQRPRRDANSRGPEAVAASSADRPVRPRAGRNRGVHAGPIAPDRNGRAPPFSRKCASGGS